MAYIIRGLDPTPYRSLIGLSDRSLEARRVVRMTVTQMPGFPCRVTLEDRRLGEDVLLLNHVSHDVANPCRSSHAIFVVEGAEAAAVYKDQLAPVLTSRVLSLRGFGADGMMIASLIAQPGEGDAAIRDLFASPAVKTIHAHNAAPGCFAARIERA